MNETFQKIKAPHKSDAIKGDCGCVLVIGGSKDYTGAPYFAALAALRAGADLVYIFTRKEALQSLKTLLPEAIVSEISFNERFLKRVTACTIGPGLGTVDDDTLEIITEIVKYLKAKDIPIILDGDGLKLYSYEVFKEYNHLILTPNINEMKRAIWLKPLHILIEKGKRDLIRFKEFNTTITEEGTKKRCGGQGDILAGVLCTFMSWMYKNKRDDLVMDYIKGGCILVRKASKKAEEKFGLSIIAKDVLEELYSVLTEVVEYDN